MARIPTYTAQTRAAAVSGTPRAQPIKIHDFSSKGLIESGNALFEIGQGLLKAADDDASLKARTNTQIKLNELELDLQRSDPMEALRSYDERARDIIKKGGEGLSVNAQRTYNSATAELAMRGKIAVQKDGIRRGRQKLEGNLIEGINSLAVAIRPDDTANDRKSRSDNVQEMLATAVANRVIDAGAAAQYFIKFQNQASQARASFEIQKNPRQFIEDASEGNEYTDLTGTQRANFIKQAKKAIKQKEKAATARKNAAKNAAQRNMNLTIKATMQDGQIPLDQRDLYTEQNLLNRGIDSDLAEKMSVRWKDHLDFIDVRDSIGANTSAKVLNTLLKQFNDDTEGEITDDRLQLQNLSQKKQINDRIKEIQKNRAAALRQQKIEINIKEKTAAREIKNVLTRIRQGGTIGEDLKKKYSRENVLKLFKNEETANNFSALLEDQFEYQNVRNQIKEGNLSTAELINLRERFKLDARAESSDNLTALALQNLTQFDQIAAAIKPQLTARQKEYIKKVQVIITADSINKKELSQKDLDIMSDANIDAQIEDLNARNNLKRIRDNALAFNEQKRVLTTISPAKAKFNIEQFNLRATQGDVPKVEQEQLIRQKDTYIKAVEAIQKNREQNPAAAMISQSSSAREAFTNFNANPSVKTYGNYRELIQVEYDRLEIPVETQRLFPKSYAKRIVSDLKNKMEQQPSEAVNTINNYKEIMGEDFNNFITDLKDLGLDDRISMLFVIDNKDLQDKLVRIISATKTSDFKTTVNTSKFTKELNETFQTLELAVKTAGIPITNAMREAVMLLTVENMRSEGHEQSIAMIRAYREVVGDNYLIVVEPKFRGVVPKTDRNEIDASRAALSLVQWHERNPDFAFEPNQFAALTRGMSEPARKKAIQELIKQASWQMTPDGQGAILHDDNGREIKDISGNSIIVNIDLSIQDSARYNRAEADRRNSSQRKSRRTVGRIGLGDPGE